VGGGAIVYGSQHHEQQPPTIPDPGPGGFRGGSGGYKFNIFDVSGFGPGGGVIADGRGGAYGTTSNNRAARYGNPSLIPLVGGSGGAGSMSDGMWAGFGSSASGGAGGGAILISCAQSINFNDGQISANGGNGLLSGDFPSGGGSGGGIRLVCERLEGSGRVSAIGGVSPHLSGNGRIRLERVVNNNSLVVTPDASVIDWNANTVPDIWPPNEANRKSPTARIVSIGGAVAPLDPKANFGTLAPDIALPIATQVEVIVETENVEESAVVLVRANPRTGAVDKDGLRVNNASQKQATIKSRIDSTPPKIQWSALVPVLPGHSAIQARIVRP
jgi:hypothetical protein